VSETVRFRASEFDLNENKPCIVSCRVYISFIAFVHPDRENTMSRTFAYARVSTADQSTENQLREIRAAGFAVDAKRAITESISGSVAASQRPAFAKLLDRLESGDVLIVTKLDRLGRNAMDVRATVERLDGLGVRVHCLALGGVDLTSPAGRMTMQVLNAVAEFERDLLIERTNAGIERAKAEGVQMGRPSALTDEQQADVLAKLAQGVSVSELARTHKTSRTTIQRIRDKT
jgi:putative DNA-invertase from lambdoid prophage Rac